MATTHSGPFFNLLIHGTAQIQSFYLISGFYMAFIIHEKYADLAHWKRKFWQARFWRLAPLYWVMTLSSFFLISLQNFNIYSIASFNQIVLAVFAQTFLFGQDAYNFFSFDPDHMCFQFCPNFNRVPNGHYRAMWFLQVQQGWSISLEMAFYLIVPFFAKRSLKVLATIFCLSLVSRIITYWVFGFNIDPWSYRFFPNEISIFLLGVFSYRFYRYKSDRLSEMVSRVLLVTVSAIIIIWDFLPGTNFAKGYSFMVLLAAALPWIFSWSLNSNWDRKLAELSYPIYLCHMIVLSLVRKYMQPPKYLLALYIAIFSVILAYALNWLIERPINRWRARFTN